MYIEEVLEQKELPLGIHTFNCTLPYTTEVEVSAVVKKTYSSGKAVEIELWDESAGEEMTIKRQIYWSNIAEQNLVENWLIEGWEEAVNA